jgi:hypothetical protein
MMAAHKRPSRNRQVGAFGEATIAKYLEALGYDNELREGGIS